MLRGNTHSGYSTQNVFSWLVGKTGKPLHLASIEHILKNPFYYGHFQYRGEVHQGSHKPMIAKKLFDQIQNALVQNGKPRKKRGPKNFQYLGFATCGICGYAITAERHIKKSGLKFIYYRCTTKSKTIQCTENRFLREEVLTEQVKNLCQKFLCPIVAGKVLTKLENENKESRHSSDLFAQNLKTELEKLRQK